MSEITQKDASRGVRFMDTRFSGIKFLEVDDDRPYKSGDHVFVGGESKVYGPYQLDLEIGRGNGKILYKAFAPGSKANSKPLSKAELEQQNAQLIARLAALESAATNKAEVKK